MGWPRHAVNNIGEPGLRIEAIKFGALEHGIENGGALAAGFGSEEQGMLSGDGNRPVILLCPAGGRDPISLARPLWPCPMPAQRAAHIRPYGLPRDGTRRRYCSRAVYPGYRRLQRDGACREQNFIAEVVGTVALSRDTLVQILRI